MSGPARSKAQISEKTFPPGTDPASIVQVSGLPDTAVMVGTPKQAEIRQSRPVEQMGEGFTEVEGGVH